MRYDAARSSSVVTAADAVASTETSACPRKWPAGFSSELDPFDAPPQTSMPTGSMRPPRASRRQLSFGRWPARATRARSTSGKGSNAWISTSGRSCLSSSLWVPTGASASTMIGWGDSSGQKSFFEIVARLSGRPTATRANPITLDQSAVGRVCTATHAPLAAPGSQSQRPIRSRPTTSNPHRDRSRRHIQLRWESLAKRSAPRMEDRPNQ